MEEQTYEEFENFDFENNESFQSGWSTLANVVDANRIGIDYLRAKVFFFSKYLKTIDLEKYLSWKKSTSSPCNCDQPTQSGDATPETDCPVEQPIVECNTETPETSERSRSTSSHSLHIHHTDEFNDVQNDDHTVVNVKSMEKDINVTNTTNCDLQSNLDSDDISKELSSCSIGEGMDLVLLSGNTSGEMARDEHDINKGDCYNKVQNMNVKVNESSKDPELKELATEDEHSSLSFLEIASHIQNGIPIPGLLSIEVQPSNLDPTPSTCPRKLKPWESSDDTKEADD